MRKRLILNLFACAFAALTATALTDAEMAVVRARLAELEGVAVDPLLLQSPTGEAEEVTGRPRLAIARSIQSFGAHFDSLEAGTEPATMALLSMARQHANLGSHEDALDWYRRAAMSGGSGSLRHVIESERLLTIAARADSAQLFVALETVANAESVNDYADESALLLRASRAYEGTRPLDIVWRKFEELKGALPSAVRVELARQRMAGGEYELALAHWRALLAASKGLESPVVAETLRGIADCSYALKRYGLASRLYTAFRSHDTGQLSAWGSFQLGVLASARGEHRDAIELFRSLCQRDGDTPWREEACWRQLQAENLVEVDEALAPYGRGLSGR